jgi:hypothetical protein
LARIKPPNRFESCGMNSPTPRLCRGKKRDQLCDGIYTKGTDPLDATILVNADVGTDVAGANELAAQLNAAGVKAKVQPRPTPTSIMGDRSVTGGT